MMPRVLLVEDDDTLVGLLRTLLIMEGFEVKAAERNHFGNLPELLQGFKPDVILMDVHMHETNGLDLLNQIRQNPSLSSIKVVMTSGIDLEDQCLSAGANSFLLKPFVPDDLMQAIRGNL